MIFILVLVATLFLSLSQRRQFKIVLPDRQFKPTWRWLALGLGYLLMLIALSMTVSEFGMGLGPVFFTAYLTTTIFAIALLFAALSRLRRNKE